MQNQNAIVNPRPLKKYGQFGFISWVSWLPQRIYGSENRLGCEDRFLQHSMPKTRSGDAKDSQANERAERPQRKNSALASHLRGLSSGSASTQSSQSGPIPL